MKHPDCESGPRNNSLAGSAGRFLGGFENTRIKDWEAKKTKNMKTENSINAARSRTEQPKYGDVSAPNETAPLSRGGQKNEGRKSK
ncbi:MAG: hypothetical protein NTZ29_12820 [Verrucomicrobia bacterium]|nr:hypothetical protein [Verrucomicrobiota bacterium]